MLIAALETYAGDQGKGAALVTVGAVQDLYGVLAEDVCGDEQEMGAVEGVVGGAGEVQ